MGRRLVRRHQLASHGTNEAEARFVNALNPNLALALAHQWRETADRHVPEWGYFTAPFPAGQDCDYCCEPWPCPDITGTAKVAEHVTAALENQQ